MPSAARMALLRGWGGPYELRTTVGPDLDRAALRDIAHELLPEERWYLQPYMATAEVSERLAGRAALAEDALRAAVEELRAVTPGVRLRGE
jgi:pyruvate-formate lyase-activating enzyme